MDRGCGEFRVAVNPPFPARIAQPNEGSVQINAHFEEAAYRYHGKTSAAYFPWELLQESRRHFNALIAAVTLTLEEVVGDLEQAVLSWIIVAAAPAAVIERSILGEDVGKNKDHSWFVSYAPAFEPELAVLALIENSGFGSRYAAPAVRAIYDVYFRDQLRLDKQVAQLPVPIALAGTQNDLKHR